jgi:hypothetical protein
LLLSALYSILSEPSCLASKIRDAYNFIAQNYREGDQIRSVIIILSPLSENNDRCSLFGFSRGAYTARKISGLIVSFRTIFDLKQRLIEHLLRNDWDFFPLEIWASSSNTGNNSTGNFQATHLGLTSRFQSSMKFYVHMSITASDELYQQVSCDMGHGWYAVLIITLWHSLTCGFLGSVRNGTQEMVDALQLHDDA